MGPVFDTSQQKLTRLSRTDRDSCRTMSSYSEVSMYYDVLPGEENNQPSPDTSLNSAFCNDSADTSMLAEEDDVAEDVPRETRLASDETLVIRSDVEDLYNQIASETSMLSSVSSSDYMDNFNPALPVVGSVAGDGSGEGRGEGSSGVVEPRGWKDWLESKGKNSAPDSVDSSGTEGESKDKKKKKKK